MTVRGERKGVRAVRVAAIAGTVAVALILGACGTKGGDDKGSKSPDAPVSQPDGTAKGSESAAPSDGSSPAASSGAESTDKGEAASKPAELKVPAGFKACMVTDQGGIDDRSFNASAWAAIEKISGGEKSQYVASKQETDYAPNIASLVGEKCSVIVTVGGLMQKATLEAAKTHPDQKYLGIDFAGNGSNIKGLEFDTAQAAALGGYLAAGYSKSGKVAVFGGMKIAPVTIFFDGFQQGIELYNKKHGKNVELIGWDRQKQDGSFVGDFSDQSKGKLAAQNAIEAGADVLLPAAGGAGLGGLAAAQAAKVAVVWVDTDGYLSASQYKDIMLTTIEKHIVKAVQGAVKETADGKFEATNYVGTLENEGIGLAPYHDFEDKVPAELKAEVEQLKADIIAGKVKIESPSSPKASS